jgi:hypothetical protein
LLPARADEWGRKRYTGFVHPLGFDKKKLSVPQPEEWLRTLRIRAATQHKFTNSLPRSIRGRLMIPEGKHLSCHYFVDANLGISRLSRLTGIGKGSNLADNSATLPNGRRSLTYQDLKHNRFNNPNQIGESERQIISMSPIRKSLTPALTSTVEGESAHPNCKKIRCVLQQSRRTRNVRRESLTISDCRKVERSPSRIRFIS